MRGQVDLRQVRLCHLLPNEGERRNEVLDQVECRPMCRPERRLGVRGQLLELLRRLHDGWLYAVPERRVPRRLLLTCLASPWGARRASPGSTALTLATLALAGSLGVPGCQQSTAARPAHPGTATGAIKLVSLGHTTAAGIEQLFGAADERAADGALAYRFERTRRGDDRRRIEVETVTFRFERGLLSKICRTRS